MPEHGRPHWRDLVRGMFDGLGTVLTLYAVVLVIAGVAIGLLIAWVI